MGRFDYGVEALQECEEIREICVDVLRAQVADSKHLILAELASVGHCAEDCDNEIMAWETGHLGTLHAWIEWMEMGGGDTPIERPLLHQALMTWKERHDDGGTWERARGHMQYLGRVATPDVK